MSIKVGNSVYPNIIECHIRSRVLSPKIKFTKLCLIFVTGARVRRAPVLASPDGQSGPTLTHFRSHLFRETILIPSVPIIYISERYYENYRLIGIRAGSESLPIPQDSSSSHHRRIIEINKSNLFFFHSLIIVFCFVFFYMRFNNNSSILASLARISSACSNGIV